jgi:hypothetical protein
MTLVKERDSLIVTELVFLLKTKNSFLGNHFIVHIADRRAIYRNLSRYGMTWEKDDFFQTLFFFQK